MKPITLYDTLPPRTRASVDSAILRVMESVALEGRIPNKFETAEVLREAIVTYFLQSIGHETILGKFSMRVLGCFVLAGHGR